MDDLDCMEGLLCPKCGQGESLEIDALVTVVLRSDGSEPKDGTHEYDDKSWTTCPECGYRAVLKEFQLTIDD